MPKRSRFVLAAILSVVLGFYPLLAPPAHRIDQAHFDKIQPWMTKADVESIFGVPPGAYDWAEADGPAWPVLYLNQVNFNVTGGRIYGLPQVTTWDLDWQRLQSPTLVINNARLWDSSGMTLYGWDSLEPAVTWTSKHGSFTVGFDRSGHVIGTGGPVGIHRVPPWQRWWRAWKK
jgi:hypothetical protein